MRTIDSLQILFETLINNRKLVHMCEIIQSNSFLICLLIFMFLLLIYLNLKEQKKYNLLILVNILIFFIFIVLYPFNIPFTDTYLELNHMLFNNPRDYILYDFFLMIFCLSFLNLFT